MTVLNNFFLSAFQMLTNYKSRIEAEGIKETALICFGKWVREQCPNQLPADATSCIQTKPEAHHWDNKRRTSTYRSTPWEGPLWLLCICTNHKHKERIVNKRPGRNLRCATDGIRIKQTKQCLGVTTVVDFPFCGEVELWIKQENICRMCGEWHGLLHQKHRHTQNM